MLSEKDDTPEQIHSIIRTYIYMYIYVYICTSQAYIYIYVLYMRIYIYAVCTYVKRYIFFHMHITRIGVCRKHILYGKVPGNAKARPGGNFRSRPWRWKSP